MTSPATTALPTDWDPTNPETWVFTTAVEPDLGVHAATGYRIHGPVTDITHRARDFGAEEAGTEAAEWWADTLGPIHDWAVRRVESTAEAVEAAYAATGIDPDDAADDLEAEARDCRRLLAALAGEVDA